MKPQSNIFQNNVRAARAIQYRYYKKIVQKPGFWKEYVTKKGNIVEVKFHNKEPENILFRIEEIGKEAKKNRIKYYEVQFLGQTFNYVQQKFVLNIINTK